MHATATQTFHDALKLHQSGELDRAEQIYREILRVDPLTGFQSVISSGANLVSPTHLALVPIPEPSTALLLASGLAAMAMAMGRGRRQFQTLANGVLGLAEAEE